MEYICTGTEQTNWDLASSEQLEIDGANTSFVLTADRLVKIEVQLGNAANLLDAAGGILAITVKVTAVDTADQCIMGQVQMNLAAGDRLARISVPTFWAKLGSTIEVHAKSNNSNDGSVGGMVWIRDANPLSVAMQEAGDVIVRGTVDGTVAPTTTEFEADDITEATADHFNDRIIIFVTGVLRYQATDITDYALAGGKGHFTVTALTEAPSNNDTFVIV